MSSVQRFLRQRQTGQTLVVGPNPNTVLTYFVLNTTGTSNYVGNYPPGVMVDASTQLATLLNAQTPAMSSGSTTTAPLLRDMGKTISATVGSSGTLGFFRAVQVLNPSFPASAISSTNFGVIGEVGGSLPSGNSGDSGYATYYIPIVVGGVIASGTSGVSTAGVALGEQL